MLFLGALEVVVLGADFVEVLLVEASAAFALAADVDLGLVVLVRAGASAVAFVAEVVAVVAAVDRGDSFVVRGVLGALGARGFLVS